LLQALHDELHAAAYLSLFDDGEIHVVDIADSPEAPRVDLWVGFHTPHTPARSARRSSDAWARPSARTTSAATNCGPDRYTITDRRSLLRDLAANRDLPLDRQEYSVGTVCVAAR
jgi:DNA-binding IclR family transcriptional regulator